MFELVDNVPQNAVIKVVGVGGGGGNAVEHMLSNQVDGVEFICANTDAQALKNMNAKTLLQLGGAVTKGLGAGANPNVGRDAALEDRERIREVLEGADMVFITAGMGGGTGTGGAPIVAEIAKEMGILTVAVVTKPFPFEGRKRMQVAMEGMKELTENVDSLITIPNEKLLAVLGPKTSLLDAFKAANDVLLGAVQGIADLIIRPGMINVDFADVRTVMSEMGMAMMGTGFSAGENRAREAAEKAIRSPLLEDVNLQGARGILVNITAGESLSLGEFSEVGDTVEEFASENATVVVGTVIDPSMGEDLRVTVVATGLGAVGEQVSPVRAVEGVTKRSPVEAVSDYKQFDKPAVDRIRREPVTESRRRPVMESDVNREYLDIPTFLRRQAD
ncbi:MAG: cell division protein FtsZ [Pseudomonadales bacterium]|jgi:cell division protein FtsZ|uniref:cell division protein FtsZ n=1 Tax=unclassified Ketobacter TaxID=2639109 RepID=UPI000C5E5405|nr:MULTISPECIES: cell division protein FtsZ [unclassified Ketobacter]MAA60799.1 cell division protein FtsZ [Pseudomonadales bacterium]MEC8811064.1 cell division protein FtsZ [Pseudomonadota bacterium]TNC88316.1 MAG: cell division protein FtsZ [Alcanivorax sp.]HAG95351.1 cell division protein FtsZ [Gammaproteobacteria bacterium]MAQ25350.1 cell division protein FtsZ [Pseudomonadales bacterium]|tara:strand:+ start:51226 stop:52395 length:1170 start_codon:yes stop_codon:yes gene_type:complete